MNKLHLYLVMFILINTLITGGTTAGWADSRDAKLQQLLKAGETAFQRADYPSALNTWQDGLKLARQTNRKSAILPFLGNLALTYRTLGEYKKALDMYQEAKQLAEALGNDLFLGRVIAGIGNLYLSREQYQQAETHLKRALSLLEKAGDQTSKNKVLSSLALIDRNRGNYQKSYEHHQRALAAKRQQGDRRGEAFHLTDLGTTYLAQRQYDQALTHFQQALVIVRELKDRKTESATLANMGSVYVSQGHHQRALELYKQALDISRDIGDQSTRSALLSNIASAYQNLGQYDRALDYLNRAKALSKKYGIDQNKSVDSKVAGVVYGQLGQYEKALESFQESLAKHKRTGNRNGEAGDLLNIGLVYEGRNDYQPAITYFKRALKLFRELENHHGESTALNNLATSYGGLRRYDRALHYGKQALALSQQHGYRRQEGVAQSQISGAYRQLGLHRQAQEAMRNAQAIFDEFKDFDQLWAIHGNRAILAVGESRFTEAIEHFDKALDMIESTRFDLNEKSNQLSFINDKLVVYDQYLKLLVRLYEHRRDISYARQALRVFERKQGRVFLESMGRSGARRFSGVPATIPNQEDQLIQQSRAVQAALFEERSKPLTSQDRRRINALDQQRRRLEQDQQSLRANIQSRYPAYHALKYPSPVTAGHLQRDVLRSGELLLIYNITSAASVLWVVGPNDFAMYPLKTDAISLRNRVAALRRAIANPAERQRGRAIISNAPQGTQQSLDVIAHQLYQLLIPPPVRAQLPNQLLYIVPTGPLYQLPFEVLVQRPKAPQQPVPLYLIDVAAVSYLSSASLLKTLRATTRYPAPYPFLAFANPVYSQNRAAATQNQSLVQTARYTALFNRLGLRSLPETEDEARAIAKLLGAPALSRHGINTLQLRENATKQNLLALNTRGLLNDYRYLLFAMHGLLTDVNQLTQPALAFSYPERFGYLSMAEVFDLKLNAHVVMLSACNTGSGDPEGAGEGIRGLTGAFLYAGAESVAVTLWAVETYSAQALSTGFFARVKDRVSPAQALRAIKRRMISGGLKDRNGQSWQHPYYWGPFVLFGDAGRAGRPLRAR